MSAPATTLSNALIHRWPTLLGVAVAILNVFGGTGREELATIIVVAASCYLAAAALGLPWMAWAAIPVAGLVVTGAELIGWNRFVVLGAVAAALVLTGLLRGVRRRPLTAQTVALLGYGAVAITALLLAPTVGLVLAALGLIGHGAWDLAHLRRPDVVSPSLAEFCVALDVPLGIAAIAVLLITA